MLRPEQRPSFGAHDVVLHSQLHMGGVCRDIPGMEAGQVGARLALLDEAMGQGRLGLDWHYWMRPWGRAGWG